MCKDFKLKLKIFLTEEKNLLLSSKKNIFGNFSVIKNPDDSFNVTIFNKYGVIQLIQENIDEFAKLPFYKDILDLLIEKKAINNINKIINICYFDLIMFSLMTDERKATSKIWTLVNFILNKKFNRAKLFEINKDSIVFDKRINNKKIKQIINKGFHLIEIPKNFSLDELEILTSSIFSLAKEKHIKDFNISLRIKKLGLYKTKGFYSKETNTMFLDPRHLNVWRHEFAHYYVAKNNLILDDEELFADTF